MEVKAGLENPYLKPDPRYGSKVVSKFINYLMHRGKKGTAQRIFYRAMDILEERVEDKTGLEIFEEALENVKPIIEVRSRRVGGMTYQVPTEVPPKRRSALAMRWVLEAARGKKGRPMYLRLADELLDAYRRQGTAHDRRETTHRMAEANRAFAHFSIRR